MEDGARRPGGQRAWGEGRRWQAGSRRGQVGSRQQRSFPSLTPCAPLGNAPKWAESRSGMQGSGFLFSLFVPGLEFCLMVQLAFRSLP